MAFNDLSFLFIFFPLFLLLHHFMPMKGKNIVLVILSLLFFAWGSPQYVVLMIFIILFNYLSGLQIAAQQEDNKHGAAKFTLISAVVANLLLLGFFKYWAFVLENVNAILGTSLPVRQIPMPLGVSFFTFSILSYLFDVYRGKAPATKNLLHFALFVSFFPKLVSGPIVPYGKMLTQINERKVTQAHFGNGVRQFLLGLSKKVLLSNILGTTFYAVTALALDEVAVVTAWLGAVSYALMLYFDFSGYSDMAIGIAEMCGFTFEKNFDYPYMSTSISEFWRRWHISLGAWFRDYLYIPLGGSRVSTVKHIRNLMIVWLCTGIWHGANWTFVVWGLFHGCIILLEKFVLKDFLEKIPGFIRCIFTLLLVLIGWVFFFSPDLGSAVLWLARMIGLGGPGFVDSTALYYLTGSAVILVISAVGAYPLVSNLTAKLYKGSKTPVIVSIVWYAFLLVLCIAGMMSSTYSSFLYFQF